MKKIIRLTESDLTDIIKRIVEESENDMESTEKQEEKLSKKEAVDLIADFFKKRLLRKMDDEEIEELKQKTSPEGLQEANKDSKSRMSNFKEKMMIRGGLGTAAAGVIATLSEFTGWSESATLSKIHTFIEHAGAGNYAGPISVAMVAAGLALALKGMDVKYRRTNK